MTHSVTKERVDALRTVADALTILGSDTDQVVRDATHSLFCAAGELACIVKLLERPKHNKRAIKQWCRDIERLGWTK